MRRITQKRLEFWLENAVHKVTLLTIKKQFKWARDLGIKDIATKISTENKRFLIACIITNHKYSFKMFAYSQSREKNLKMLGVPFVIFTFGDSMRILLEYHLADYKGVGGK